MKKFKVGDRVSSTTGWSGVVVSRGNYVPVLGGYDYKVKGPGNRIFTWNETTMRYAPDKYGKSRSNPGRSKVGSALTVADDMRHDIDIFYGKYREPGNKYYVAFHKALKSRDSRKMLAAFRAMAHDLDIFYSKYRDPGNKYHAAVKALIGKPSERKNPASGKPKFKVGDRVRLVSRFKKEVQRGVVTDVDRGGKAAPGYVYQFEALNGNRAWAIESNLYHDRKYGK